MKKCNINKVIILIIFLAFFVININSIQGAQVDCGRQPDSPACDPVEPSIYAKTITISPSAADVTNSKNFIATVLDQFGDPMTSTVTWTSSNPAVGTIDTSGKFTALAAGTTIITAARGTVSKTATVTVIQVLTTISVSSSTIFLNVGGIQTFTSSPKDQFGNAIAATISWTSSNTAIGTIDASSGMFTALAAGTTIITAAGGAVSGTAQ